MPGMNSRNAYEFDPRVYGIPAVANLYGRLQPIASQQDSQVDANIASNPDAGAHDSPGGLLGRLLALQADQSQSVTRNAGLAQSQPRDPNFRQLSSPIFGMRSSGANDLSSRSGEGSYPSPYSSDASASL